MNILGFNFTKISSERPAKLAGPHKISSSMELLEMDKDSINVLKDNEIIRAVFKYSINYEPSKAAINFEGNVLLSAPQDVVKESLKLWKKKQVNEKIKLPLFSFIFNKCTLKALQLQEELGLPHHIKLPKLASSPNQDQ